MHRRSLLRVAATHGRRRCCLWRVIP